jgi:hypothetical protein
VRVGGVRGSRPVNRWSAFTTALHRHMEAVALHKDETARGGASNDSRVTAAEASTSKPPHLPYYIPPPSSVLIRSGEFQYIETDADFEWCLTHDVSLAALRRLVTLLETTYANELIALFESETAHGRAFSEARGGARGASVEHRVRSDAYALVSSLNRGALRKRVDGVEPCAVCSAPLAPSPAVLGPALTCAGCGTDGHAICLGVPRATAEDARALLIAWRCDRCQGDGASHAGVATSVCALCCRPVSFPATELVGLKRESRSSSSAQRGAVSGEVNCDWVHTSCAWAVSRWPGFILDGGVLRVDTTTIASHPTGDSNPERTLWKRRGSSVTAAEKYSTPCVFCDSIELTQPMSKGASARTHTCGTARGLLDRPLLLKCAAARCHNYVHPSCAAERAHTELRPAHRETESDEGVVRYPCTKGRQSGNAALYFDAFWPAHSLVRDLRSGWHTPPLDAHTAILSTVAEKMADVGLEARAVAFDAPHIPAVTSHWRATRSLRRVLSGRLVASIKAEESPLIEAVGYHEVVRRSEDGMLGLSSALSLIPELQLHLSRRLEGELWAPLIFTSASLPRVGFHSPAAMNPTFALFPGSAAVALNGAHGNEQSDEATTPLLQRTPSRAPKRGASAAGARDHTTPRLGGGPRPEHHQQPLPASAREGYEHVVPTLQRLASATSLLCSLGEHVRSRELAKAALLEVDLEEAETLLRELERSLDAEGK